MSDDDGQLRLVLERSRELGFLGPGDVDSHLLHAEGFVHLLAAEADVLDLGSGGGLPGLVVARRHPSIAMTLLDANERRVAFLRDAVRQLDLRDRVSVELGRAETLARRTDLRSQFGAVAARSFGAPAVTAECAAGFLREGGRLLVSEPPDSDDRWPTDALASIGLVPSTLHSFDQSTIRELIRTRSDLDAVPRRVGVPARRPIF